MHCRKVNHAAQYIIRMYESVIIIKQHSELTIGVSLEEEACREFCPESSKQNTLVSKQTINKMHLHL